MVRLGKEPAVTYEITDTHAMFVKGSQPPVVSSWWAEEHFIRKHTHYLTYMVVDLCFEIKSPPFLLLTLQWITGFRQKTHTLLELKH